jgi:hypothetical protein
MMIVPHSLVVYKNRPAIVRETAGDKIHIELANGELVKVREKDVELIHPGPVKDFNILEGGGGLPADTGGQAAAREASSPRSSLVS